ncbi:killer toxin subunits alpha/beta [Aspergillus udagawae]|uniref:Killer toxin subunits alpha/beta n=1 Tax=Aspergillus udagawae TaxID=91492 RepID=A0ABQ1AI19_9EURO|nr:killer toxin subunits alpha/beta [Aspergillus udagawae]GFG05786.1 killer toxin subunits alpha/beta [Aspergillus udagawae]
MHVVTFGASVAPRPNSALTQVLERQGLLRKAPMVIFTTVEWRWSAVMPLFVFRSIAYFEGYSFSSRDCLYQDALQITGRTLTTWDQSSGPYTNVPNYPCIPHQAPDHCGDLTIVDQTSDASPSVSDCMQIVNIQNTDGDWEVANAIGNQHQLMQFGSCAFRVQGQGKNGNIDFNVGAQDIVDIITDSVRQFGGSGKVGAMGVLPCDGTVKGQQVEWGYISCMMCLYTSSGMIGEFSC